jgi:hypothetical protein
MSELTDYAAARVAKELLPEACNTCEFWLLTGSRLTRESTGYCRRFPQAVYKQGIDWCGEWKPKQE